MINIKRYGSLCLSAILAAAFILTPAVKAFARKGIQRQTGKSSGRPVMQNQQTQMN